MLAREHDHDLGSLAELDFEEGQHEESMGYDPVVELEQLKQPFHRVGFSKGKFNEVVGSNKIEFELEGVEADFLLVGSDVFVGAFVKWMMDVGFVIKEVKTFSDAGEDIVGNCKRVGAAIVENAEDFDARGLDAKIEPLRAAVGVGVAVEEDGDTLRLVEEMVDVRGVVGGFENEVVVLVKDGFGMEIFRRFELHDPFSDVQLGPEDVGIVYFLLIE